MCVSAKNCFIEHTLCRVEGHEICDGLAFQWKPYTMFAVITLLKENKRNWFTYLLFIRYPNATLITAFLSWIYVSISLEGKKGLNITETS